VSKGVGKFIGLGAIKLSKPRWKFWQKEESKQKIDLEVLDRARLINRIFSRCKAEYTGGARPFSEDSMAFKTFLKLAERLSTESVVDYVHAHFEVYGEDTYPNHLLSGHSRLIHQAFALARRSPVIEMGIEQRERHEIELLIVMSTVWNLNLQETFNVMYALFPTLEARYGNDPSFFKRLSAKTSDSSS
jgi:hypothetical protein